MIAALLLTLAVTQAEGRPATAAVPGNWGALPVLRYDRRPALPAGLDEFVRGEIAAGRCTMPGGTAALRVEMAVLVEAGAPVRVVPRAIGCATVEQFAAGLMSRIARDDLDRASPDGWYRATLDFGRQR